MGKSVRSSATRVWSIVIFWRYSQLGSYQARPQLPRVPAKVSETPASVASAGSSFAMPRRSPAVKLVGDAKAKTGVALAAAKVTVPMFEPFFCTSSTVSPVAAILAYPVWWEVHGPCQGDLGQHSCRAQIRQMHTDIERLGDGHERGAVPPRAAARWRCPRGPHRATRRSRSCQGSGPRYRQPGRRTRHRTASGSQEPRSAAHSPGTSIATVSSGRCSSLNRPRRSGH